MRTYVKNLTLAALVVISLPARGQTSSRPDDALLGIWSSESIFGPALRGTLTVINQGRSWRAMIASAETGFTVNGDSVRFAFAAGLGEFRGALTRDRKSINGWWIQPKGVAGAEPDDPGGLRQPFASPLTLSLSRTNVWHGNVVPVDDRFGLYLSIWRGTSGLLTGAFRNPEMNARGGSGQFRVTLVRDSVIFTARPDTSRPEVRRAAMFDTAHRQMVLWWPPIQGFLVLKPRSPNQAIGFFAKVPVGLKYSYVAPTSENDGWATTRANAVGFDEAALERLVQRLADTLSRDARAPLVHSLLIARKGKLVLEEYFRGFDRNRPHDTRSAAKTFASVMLGAAVMKGFPLSPETSIASLLRHHAPFENSDPRKARITLAHLMTHTSGLACDDNDDDSPGNESNMQSQSAQPNWWKYMMNLAVTHEPGSHRAYCSGGMNLVGAGIVAVTKTWLPEFFERSIAKPLQFGRYYYNLMPTQEGYTGGGVYMRPRDLMKIGQVYLAGGVWNGKRVVPKAWVERSIAKQVEWPAQSENVSAGADGYAWHLNTLKSGMRVYREYEANGNGGQLLMVVPELELVVVFTAGNYGGYGVWGRFRDDLVPNAIIPAIVPIPGTGHRAPGIGRRVAGSG